MQRCRQELLSGIAQAPNQLGSAEEAQALDALAQLPAGAQTAALLLELLLQAGRNAARVQTLEAEVAQLRVRVDGYQQAVAKHVRDFPGARDMRAAINQHVHSLF